MKLTNWVYILGIIATFAFPNTCNALKKPEPNVQQASQILSVSLTAPSTYRDNIYRLILAEIALQQHKPKIAIKNYLEIIKTAKDAKIAEMALECALKNKAFNEAVEIAVLWADIAKQDIHPIC